MAYSCGNCGLDHQTKKQLVQHMVDVHNSPFLEGDDGHIKMSKARAQEKGNAKALAMIAENE